MSQISQQDEQQSYSATVVNQHVGRKIRERRIMMGLSLQQLAHIIGVSLQQTQKYERAQNRVSAGRLFAIAQALASEPAWFFEGLTEQGAVNETSPRQRLCLELARNFSLINDENHQQAISSMARALADT